MRSKVQGKLLIFDYEKRQQSLAVETVDSETRLPGFQAWLCHSQAVGLEAWPCHSLAVVPQFLHLHETGY